MKETRDRFISKIEARLSDSDLSVPQFEEIRRQAEKWAEYFDKRIQNGAMVGSRFLLGERVADAELQEMSAHMVIEMELMLQDFASRILHLYVALVERGYRAADLEDFMATLPTIQETARNGVTMFKESHPGIRPQGDIAGRLIDYLLVKFGDRLFDPGLTVTADMIGVSKEEFTEFISPHLRKYFRT